jgi:hypothetical protein
VASLDDGSMRLLVDALGVRAEVDVDDSTPARRELLAALDAGTIRGGSFGWVMLRNRWHLDRLPVRVEVIDALVHEISFITAPHSPRYRDTWAGALGPGMAKLYHRLDQQRARCMSRACAPEPAADLVLTLKPNFYGMWAPIMRLLEDQTAPEWKAVQEAARCHPDVRTIDVRYLRTVRSCEEVVRRRFPPPVVVAPAPSPPPSSAPRGERPMAKPSSPESVWNEGELERRPAMGYGRPSDTAAALRGLAKHRAEHAARQRAQRRPSELTIVEAKRRMARYGL